MVTNFRKEAVSWKVPEGVVLKGVGGEGVLISNYGELAAKEEVVRLRPFEAFACLVE